MLQKQKCVAITRNGAQCKNYALTGFQYCTTHAAEAYGDKVRPRRKLTRSAIIQSIRDNDNSAQNLDLTFADLSDENLESDIVPMPNMSGVIFGRYGAILSGPVAHRTIFQHMNLTGAKLTYGDFTDANFFKCNLANADLRFAKFDGASLGGANLPYANLCGSSFYNTKFRNVNLEGADLYLAQFSGRTGLSKENFGNGILQERQQDYKEYVVRFILPDSRNPLEHHLADRQEKAASIYRQLRIHFAENGKSDDVRWAYLRERKMTKIAHRKAAFRYYRQANILEGVKSSLSWLSDMIAELLCNYGESIWRVIFWLFAHLLVIGPLLIVLCGGLIWPQRELNTYLSIRSPVYQGLYWYLQHLLYVLDTLTTSNYAILEPGNDIVRLVSGFLALTGIFLAGLLGFVAGNRIHRL